MIEQLNKALYRNVEFFFVSSTIDGSKKFVRHVFVGGNKQKIDEFGLNTRSFTVDGYIAATGDKQYYDERDKLLAALELPGPDVFIHPTFGRIENVVAVSYSFDEDVNNLGIGSITIQFEISNTDGAPTEAATTVSEVSQAFDVSSAAIQASIEEGFEVDPRLLGVYDAAVAKIEEIGNAVEDALAFAAKLEDQIDIVSNTISDFQDTAFALASAPANLASSITNIFETINASVASAFGAFEAYRKFFGFGFLTDIELRFNTYAISKTKANRNLLNNAMNGNALVGAYFAMARKDYNTVDEIDADIVIVEEQLSLISEQGTMDPDAYDAILDARSITLKLLNERRLITNTIIDVDANLSSARALAYQYYGSTDEADRIIKLNGGLGIFMTGTTRMLAK